MCCKIDSLLAGRSLHVRRAINFSGTMPTLQIPSAFYSIFRLCRSYLIQARQPKRNGKIGNLKCVLIGIISFREL